MGVDVINSSLGYNTFDTPEFNHTTADFGTNTAIISQAAKLASEKGILVFSAAGNEGGNSWGKLLFPADVESIVSVGAVDTNGDKASFSSIGESSLAYTTPSVSALGKGIYVSSSNSSPKTSNGTSFACPLLAGLGVCLWQVLREESALEIKKIIEESASQYASPDVLIGHGIPNFKKAFQTNGVQLKNTENNSDLLIVNPVLNRTLSFRLQDVNEIPIKIEVVDLDGRIIQTVDNFTIGTNSFTVKMTPENLRFCIIQITTNKKKYSRKVLLK